MVGGTIPNQPHTVEGMTTTDAAGNLHDSLGQFSGHLQVETTPELVLPAPPACASDPAISAEEKDLLTRYRGHFWVGPHGYSDEPMGPHCEEVLSRFTRVRVAAAFNEYRGEGETDTGDPAFVVFDENGTAFWAPELDRWLNEDPDDPEVTFPVHLFDPTRPADLSDYEYLGQHLVASTNDSDEEPCRSCGAINDDGEGEDGQCGNCADRCACHICGERICHDPADAPADSTCQECRDAAAEEYGDEG